VVPHAAPQPTPPHEPPQGGAPQAVPQPTPQPAPHATPHAAPHPTPHAAPQPPHAPPQAAPHAAPQAGFAGSTVSPFGSSNDGPQVSIIPGKGGSETCDIGSAVSVSPVSIAPSVTCGSNDVSSPPLNVPFTVTSRSTPGVVAFTSTTSSRFVSRFGEKGWPAGVKQTVPVGVGATMYGFVAICSESPS
jgi:hypothetical protein